MRKRIRTGDIFVICACEEDGCALYGEEKGINPDDFFVAGVPICSECGEDLIYRRTEIEEKAIHKMKTVIPNAKTRQVPCSTCFHKNTDSKLFPCNSCGNSYINYKKNKG